MKLIWTYPYSILVYDTLVPASLGSWGGKLRIGADSVVLGKVADLVDMLRRLRTYGWKPSHRLKGKLEYVNAETIMCCEIVDLTKEQSIDIESPNLAACAVVLRQTAPAFEIGMASLAAGSLRFRRGKAVAGVARI